LVVLLAPPLRAQEKAQKLLTKGRYLARTKKDCNKALAVLEEARKAAKSSRIRASVFVNIAVCSVALGNRDAARAALREALALNPRLVDYAGRYGKTIQSLFAELKTYATGMLSVISNRPKALVYVDGREVGPAPFLGPIPVGPHTVEVRTRDGRWRHRESVVVDKGGYVSITSSLKKVEGTLTVLSTPPGVKVYVDDEIVGSTPVRKTPLPTGTYTVSLRKPGYATRSRVIKISEDRLTSVFFTLKPQARGPLGRRAHQPPRRRYIWTWVAAGGALAALTVGAGLGIAVQKDAEDYAATPEDQTQQLYDLEQGMRDRALTANVLFGVSGALAASAVVLFFWEGGWFSKERNRASASSSLSGRLTPVVGQGKAGITWTMDF